MNSVYIFKCDPYPKGEVTGLAMKMIICGGAWVKDIHVLIICGELGYKDNPCFVSTFFSPAMQVVGGKLPKRAVKNTQMLELTEESE